MIETAAHSRDVESVWRSMRALPRSAPAAAARAADRGGSGGAAQGQQGLGLRTQPVARRCSRRALAVHQARKICALRSGIRLRVPRDAVQTRMSCLAENRYNDARATARRANEGEGVLSNGSIETTIRKRVSSQTRKGVGDSLAGGGDCSRRPPREKCCVTKRWARSRASRRLTPSRRITAAGNGKAATRSRVTFRIREAH